MKIIIIGDGKVGYKLAKQLSKEEYDIVLIDNNAKKLREATDQLDISCVTGDGCSVQIQQEANVPDADLVIACTSTDECNMLSCLIAKRLGAKHTIARVRNPIYYNQIDILKEDLHLSMTVNPEFVVATEISRLLIFPDANKIETFMKGKVELIEFPLFKESQFIGLSLSDIYKKFHIRMVVCVAERGEDVFIPDGDYVCAVGDKIHMVVSRADLKKFFKAHGYHKTKIKNVLICGGGRVSVYLGLRLCDLGMHVKIIEINEDRCEALCDILPKATIIHGDANSQDLLVEEGVHSADAFVALTGMDEENIIMSLYAKSQGVSKIIVKVNEDRRARMIEDFGLDSIVSAKSATADVIQSYVRGHKNTQSSANVETLYHLVDDRVEAMEFIIKSQADYTDIPLSKLEIKSNNLIACIARGVEIIIPSGDDEIQVGDRVMIITMEKHIQDLKDIMV